MGKDLAGKGVANPTAELLASCMMLRHLKLPNYADRLEGAVLKVYGSGDSGVKTRDAGGSGSLRSFTDAVIANL